LILLNNRKICIHVIIMNDYIYYKKNNLLMHCHLMNRAIWLNIFIHIKALQYILVYKIYIMLLFYINSEQLMELFPSRSRRRFSRGLKRKPMALIKRLRKAKKEAGPLEKPEVK